MNQLVEGIHYYINDAGLVVLTEKFLLERGFCCGNGCIHCPFGFQNVPEPYRSKLQEIKKNKQLNAK
jgi:hypothetical protein